MVSPLYRKLAQLINARTRCLETGNAFKVQHEAEILRLVREHMPSGSGIDKGTTIDLDASTDEKIVFRTEFHHMDEHGYYDGWTEHTITVCASLVFGLDLKIDGRDRNEIKEYLHEVFSHALSAEIN